MLSFCVVFFFFLFPSIRSGACSPPSQAATPPPHSDQSFVATPARRRCHAIASGADAPETAATFSYLTRSDLIPLLPNKPLDHPANFAARSIRAGGGRQEKGGGRGTKKKDGKKKRSCADKQCVSLQETFEATYQRRAVGRDKQR